MDTSITVTVPAVSYALVTVEVLKDELGITDIDTARDARYERWIGEESDRIMEYTDRVFQIETVVETFNLDIWPFWPPYGAPDPLVLTRRPIVSIASVTVDGSTLSASEYEIDKGRLWRMTSGRRTCWRSCRTAVTYTGGYATIPSTLQQACMTLVNHRISARTRDPNLRSVTIEGVGQKVFWVGATGEVGDFPPDVVSALDRFRDKVIA